MGLYSLGKYDPHDIRNVRVSAGGDSYKIKAALPDPVEAPEDGQWPDFIVPLCHLIIWFSYQLSQITYARF